MAASSPPLAKEGQKASWAAWPWHLSCSALHLKVPSSLTGCPHITTTKNEACWGSLCWLHTSLIAPKEFLECLTRVWVVGGQRGEVVPATAQRGLVELTAPQWLNGALGPKARDVGPGPTPTVLLPTLHHPWECKALKGPGRPPVPQLINMQCCGQEQGGGCGLYQGRTVSSEGAHLHRKRQAVLGRV